MSNHIKIVYNIQGKACGVIEGTVLRKKIGERHFLRQPPAIAFDCSILNQAESLGVTDVEVVSPRGIYRAPLSAFREFGFSVNRGFGPQIGLVLSRFSLNGAPPAFIPKPEPAAQARTDCQLPLFSGGGL